MQELISKYPNHLICDAASPMITNNLLEDELLLYNLDEQARLLLYEHFQALCSRRIEPSFRPEELSGGQKVILMVLLAMLSPAERIAFIHLYDSLDPARIREINLLIDNYRNHKDILVVQG